MILFEIYLFNYHFLHRMVILRHYSVIWDIKKPILFSSRWIISIIVIFSRKLSMEVRELYRTKKKKPIRICSFWRFTHSETLSNFYCDKCQMSMSANIKLMISQAPIVACFHLKVKWFVRSKDFKWNHLRFFFFQRFQYVKKSRSKMRKKISAHISFPDQLDLTPYMTTSNTSRENATYSLFAVISHFGSSVETGHYMCYVKLQLQNRW